MPFHPPLPSSKPFKYVQVCQSQSSASLCDVKTGKVRVDCCFLMSKTRWGELHGHPLGLMYLDLTFHQPAECKLAHATITMTFRNMGRSRPGLEVTEFFGPQSLSGEKRERQVSTTLEANPKIGAATANVEGIGLSRKSAVTHASRWKFTGSRFAAEPSIMKATRSSQYRQLVWHLEENELEQQAVHHSTVHTGVAFHHTLEPFYLDLQIEVKMQRWHHRIRQHLVCPPRNRKALTRAKIDPVSSKTVDPSFPQLAMDLNQAMIEKNLHPVVEVSDPRPATFGDDLQDLDKVSVSDSLLSLARQVTGQVPPDAASTATDGSFTSPQAANSSTSTLIGSDDGGEVQAAVPEPKDPLSSITNAEVTKANSVNPNGLHILRLVAGHLSRVLAALVASLILGLTGVQSALARAAQW
ncbi:hypothetical protein BO78DRAFT_308414 [Aspergillus sclerotiicarbonarius CBS 121057]|uniref:Uncharacterized protein n=1 Tax=Aspergillus sclerotiicarbonarius (strain CBS 121057 / IBT 28362) TaxID=1448318 RepID=A0A319EPI9_ASPSB|nr:hypothetical protein BO78DRAFT_308414 [Aspergillus sclerotiicarbonarius CBS 121057]